MLIISWLEAFIQLDPIKHILNRNRFHYKQPAFVQLPKVIQNVHSLSTNYFEFFHINLLSIGSDGQFS